MRSGNRERLRVRSFEGSPHQLLLRDLNEAKVRRARWNQEQEISGRKRHETESVRHRQKRKHEPQRDNGESRRRERATRATLERIADGSNDEDDQRLRCERLDEPAG